jgi:hypothetical protein
MSLESKAGADSKQSAGDPDVTVEQSRSPAPPLYTEIAVGDKGHRIVIDRPYSVFTDNEKWLIVILASCAAVFR